jgi:hypothetical protein
MRSGWKHGIGILLLVALAAAAPARAEGPGPDFKRLEERGDTFKSPDNTLVIEQYSKDLGGYEGFTYQVFDKDHKNPFLLNRDYDTQTGKFSVPGVFAEHNAKARMLPKPNARRG